MSVGLVDSHCHLDFADFDSERDQVLARARDAGVGWMLTIATDLERFDAVRDIAASLPNVFCSVGVHPHEAAKAKGLTAEALLERARHPKVVGFGETGLDYHYEHSPKPDQVASFKAHIDAAREAGLPIIIHTREADADTADILEAEYAKGPFPGLIHCFTAGAEFAERALAIGFSISFSGIVTFKKADDLRAIAKRVPLDRILVETDSPYLAPVPKRGSRNEPAFVALTAAFLAELKGVPLADFTQATTDNFFRLFTKATKAGTGAGTEPARSQT